MKFRNFAAVGLPSVISILLVGSVAYACAGTSGGDEPNATQQLSVVLSANGATGNNTPDITLAPFSQAGSSFATAPNFITITNNGNVTATGVALQLSDHHTNTAYESETWTCLYSNGVVYFNEPLTTVEGYGQTALQHLTLIPGATDTYTLVYYAGSNEKVGCGSAFTGYSAVSLNGFAGQYSTTKPYTSGTTNVGAFALTNPAEGGTITPTATISYVGEGGIITQIAPFSNTTSSVSSSRFDDQLETTGQKGKVTFVTTSSNAHLGVSSSGLVLADTRLSTGKYTVSGTDSDASDDTGIWTYTLTVTAGAITCVGIQGRSVDTHNSGNSFVGQINTSGWSGTVWFSATSPNSHLHVSSGGTITTTGSLSIGKYTVSGTDSDTYGDTGTWTYTLTVTP